jgi:hypothetical protein
MAVIELRVEQARFQGAADALSTILTSNFIEDDIVAAGIKKQLNECYNNLAIYTIELKLRTEGKPSSQAMCGYVDSVEYYDYTEGKGCSGGKPSSQAMCGIDADYVDSAYFDDTVRKGCSGKGKITAYPGKCNSSGKGKFYGESSSGKGNGKDKNREMYEIRVHARSGYSGASTEYYGWVERNSDTSMQWYPSSD